MINIKKMPFNNMLVEISNTRRRCLDQTPYITTAAHTMRHRKCQRKKRVGC